jgi:two-component system NtrC family sensor kinase
VELDEDATGRVWRVTAWPSSEPESEAGGSAFSVCQYEDITKQRALQRQVILLEKVAAIGELAGCVAHELNNPLTGILTFSQILARGTGMGADETQSLASEIESSAERCKFIVQALLDFARPGATLEYSPVDLAEVVDSCVRLVTVSQKSFRDMKLELDFEQRLPEVLGNSDALKSVFLNLVSNAVQAMSPGGVLRIRAGVEPDGRRVRIVVEDNGPGIPAHLRERVFEPFFTTKATNKSGTGLGLTIVRNVVRDHGGQLELGGSPEGGACFTIHLPVAHPATGVPDRRAP